MFEVSDRLFTVEDVLRMDGEFELDRGVPVRIMPSDAIHSCVSSNVGILLGTHVKQHRLGRVLANDPGFILTRNPDTLRGPDMAFISSANATKVPKGFIPGAPDVAIEVVGPLDNMYEVIHKTAQYLEAGARLAWTVDCERRRVIVYRADGDIQVLGETETLSGEDVVPGFECRVAELFEDCE